MTSLWQLVITISCHDNFYQKVVLTKQGPQLSKVATEEYGSDFLSNIIDHFVYKTHTLRWEEYFYMLPACVLCMLTAYSPK